MTKIFTFYPTYQPTQFDLFALSRGLNSGKPLTSPCPNCFVIVCQNQSEYDFYHTLLFGLWKAKHFYPFHIGSVIPFVRIGDFKNEVFIQSNIQKQNEVEFADTISKVKQLEIKEKQMRENLLLISELKQAMIVRHLRSR